MEAVTTALGVEKTAAWHEYGPPSSADVALPEHWFRDRFLMLQWTDETGWSLAIEPDGGGEPPHVLATWPDDVYPAPAELAATVHTVLETRLTIPIVVPQENHAPCS